MGASVDSEEQLLMMMMMMISNIVVYVNVYNATVDHTVRTRSPTYLPASWLAGKPLNELHPFMSSYCHIVLSLHPPETNHIVSAPDFAVYDAIPIILIKLCNFERKTTRLPLVDILRTKWMLISSK